MRSPTTSFLVGCSPTFVTSYTNCWARHGASAHTGGGFEPQRIERALISPALSEVFDLAVENMGVEECARFISAVVNERLNHISPHEAFSRIKTQGIDVSEAGDVLRFKKLCHEKFGQRFQHNENFRHQAVDALLTAVENIDK